MYSEMLGTVSFCSGCESPLISFLRRIILQQKPSTATAYRIKVAIQCLQTTWAPTASIPILLPPQDRKPRHIPAAPRHAFRRSRQRPLMMTNHRVFDQPLTTKVPTRRNGGEQTRIPPQRTRPSPHRLRPRSSPPSSPRRQHGQHQRPAPTAAPAKRKPVTSRRLGHSASGNLASRRRHHHLHHATHFLTYWRTTPRP